MLRRVSESCLVLLCYQIELSDRRICSGCVLNVHGPCILGRATFGLYVGFRELYDFLCRIASIYGMCAANL
jgi:hypothetical protein